MSRCPVCQNEMNDAFGIVQCPKCETMLVAEFDGTLRVQDEVISSEPAEVPFENPGTQNFDPIDMAPTEPTSVSEDAPASADFGGNFETFPPVSEQASHPDVEDVRQFGESEDSRLEDGEFLYTLIFEAVDTEELKANILDALKEKRLAISEGEQVQIHESSVHILKLNPVKLSVLVQKLKSLPIHIRWEQESLLR